MNINKNIFLVGLMGSGKSTFGKILGNELKMQFYDSDRIMEKFSNCNIKTIFNVYGEKFFRDYESEIIDYLTKKNKIILSTGAGAILSSRNRNFLSSRGIIIYLKVSSYFQYDRIQKDNYKNRLYIYDNDRHVLNILNKKRKPLYNTISNIHINTDGLAINSIKNSIIEKINNY